MEWRMERPRFRAWRWHYPSARPCRLDQECGVKYAAVSFSLKSCAIPPRLLWKLVVPVMACLIVGARLVDFTPGGHADG